MRSTVVTAAFHAGDHAAQKRWADAFEASIAAGRGYTTLETGEFLCAHNHVTPAVRRNPALDPNVVQAEGQAACIAAQIAALAAEETK